MHKLIPTGLLVALLVLTGLWFVERRELAQLRQQNAALRQEVNESLVALNAESELERQQAKHFQQHEKDKAEAIRLRGEVSRLRQQLKQSESSQRAGAASVNQPPASTNAPVSSHIQSFTAQVRATLAWNQTLLTGGWQTEPGRHCFLLIEAQKLPADLQEGGPLQLEIRSKYLELPDVLIAKLGLASHITEKNETQAQAILTREQTAAIFAAATDQPDVDLLSAPTVTTANNREAQIKTVDVITTPDGQEHELGPVVNIVPHIPERGESVLLSVTAQLKRRAR